MQFFDVKANKIYNYLYQMPLNNQKNQSKNTANKFPQEYDSFYNFFFQGKRLSVPQIQKLYKSRPNDQKLIIAKKKSNNIKVIDPQHLYDSHRYKIEEYLKETKENDVKAIKQNAEFIFQKTIDGNFKFRAFQQFDSVTEFTAERKQSLLNEIYQKICNDPSQSIDVIDWAEKQNESKVFGESARKLQKIEQKAEENDESEQENQVKVAKMHKIQEPRVFSVKKERGSPLKSQRINLQLHELAYITEQWKQIQAINKYLMRHSCDNPSYHEQAKIRQVQVMREELAKRKEQEQQI